MIKEAAKPESLGAQLVAAFVDLKME